MTDPFRYHDGAYVLGALDDLDRRAFETHLSTCAECGARVAAARPAAGLLAGLTLSDLGDPEPVPDTLLPGLLRAARRERSRRRGLLSGLTAVAAACAAALVVALWPGGSSGPGPNAASRAFAQLRPSPVSATGLLVSHAWGTEIDLHCRYATGVDQYLPYRLVVVDKQNVHLDAGSWTLAPGGETDFVGGTSVQRSDIARVEITLADGTPILVMRGA
jgi:hypothetical protein